MPEQSNALEHRRRYYQRANEQRRLKRQAERVLPPPVPGEIWKSVVGFEGLYEVSNLARVRSVRAAPRTFIGMILRPAKTSTGYHFVLLRRDGHTLNRSVHRLVANAFLGEPPTSAHQVNHRDGTRINNVVGNLEWVTAAENVRDAFARRRRSLSI